MNVTFDAPEYHTDTVFRAAKLSFEGSVRKGWRLTRDGATTLELGPGYRPFEVIGCGVCSTDLARHFLPFPLPQVTGHEILAADAEGRRVALEINASHEARGVEDACPFCARGLATHCPSRLVLGIHDLPGGFGPRVLAPKHAAVIVPAEIPDESAVLVEPLAAALHAVRMVRPRAGDRIAVLGPRRLGMLVVAALAAERARSGVRFGITALARRETLITLARGFGADDGVLVVDDGDAIPSDAYDVVIDTTGNPAALPLALRLARREVHLKSTHGQPAGGVTRLTELVVDELSLAPFPTDWSGITTAAERPTIAWTLPTEAPEWLTDRADVREGSPAAILATLEARPPASGLPRADLAVVQGADGIDRAIRPVSAREVSVVAPRGTILIVSDGSVGESALVDELLNKGLRLTSSRCGSFRAALELMTTDEQLRDVGAKLTTHQFDARDLNDVFRVARSRECLKAVVWHDGRPVPAASGRAGGAA